MVTVVFTAENSPKAPEADIDAAAFELLGPVLWFYMILGHGKRAEGAFRLWVGPGLELEHGYIFLYHGIGFLLAAAAVIIIAIVGGALARR